MYPRGPVKRGGRLTKLLDRFPNLYCDLSAESGLNALRRDPENARAFLTRYQDRLLFGRDFWDDRLFTFLGTLDLPVSLRRKLLSGNALKLVPLP